MIIAVEFYFVNLKKHGFYCNLRSSFFESCGSYDLPRKNVRKTQIKMLTLPTFCVTILYCTILARRYNFPLCKGYYTTVEINLQEEKKNK
jgi:hypothetical protein